MTEEIIYLRENGANLVYIQEEISEEQFKAYWTNGYIRDVFVTRNRLWGKSVLGMADRVIEFKDEEGNQVFDANGNPVIISVTHKIVYALIGGL